MKTTIKDLLAKLKAIQESFLAWTDRAISDRTLAVFAWSEAVADVLLIGTTLFTAFTLGWTPAAVLTIAIALIVCTLHAVQGMRFSGTRTAVVPVVAAA